MLVLLIALLGPALQRIPIQGLRLVVGALLLAFGLQWLTQGDPALERVDRALHDEREAIREGRGRRPPRADARAARGAATGTAFTVAFKGVFLEGLEVVPSSWSPSAGRAGATSASPSAGAAAALVVVVVAGVAARGPLSRVPENTIKFAVGLLLTTFGCFWAAEGAGVDWPGDELSRPAVLAFFGLVLVLLVRSLRRRHRLVPVGAKA